MIEFEIYSLRKGSWKEVVEKLRGAITASLLPTSPAKILEHHVIGIKICDWSRETFKTTSLPPDDCIIDLPYYSNPFGIWTGFFVFKVSIAMVNCRDAENNMRDE
ncbi:hypothetical protein OIU76_022774 [Salix suchowensis]|nr:hypothetical protein OIU76_022774 [Salix suchowensis]KAJ6373504.1 hypothetical protein OIU78_029233 [Salix suchowensis]